MQLKVVCRSPVFYFYASNDEYGRRQYCKTFIRVDDRQENLAYSALGKAT